MHRPGDRVVLCGLFRPGDVRHNGAAGTVLCVTGGRCFVLPDRQGPAGGRVAVLAAHPINVAPEPRPQCAASAAVLLAAALAAALFAAIFGSGV